MGAEAGLELGLKGTGHVNGNATGSNGRLFSRVVLVVSLGGKAYRFTICFDLKMEPSV